MWSISGGSVNPSVRYHFGSCECPYAARRIDVTGADGVTRRNNASDVATGHVFREPGATRRNNAGADAVTGQCLSAAAVLESRSRNNAADAVTGQCLSLPLFSRAGFQAAAGATGQVLTVPMVSPEGQRCATALTACLCADYID